MFPVAPSYDEHTTQCRQRCRDIIFKGYRNVDSAAQDSQEGTVVAESSLATQLIFWCAIGTSFMLSSFISRGHRRVKFASLCVLIPISFVAPVSWVRMKKYDELDDIGESLYMQIVRDASNDEDCKVYFKAITDSRKEGYGVHKIFQQYKHMSEEVEEH